MIRIGLILLTTGVSLGACDFVNSYPNEYGIQTKQNFSPQRVGGYTPGKGKVAVQPRGFLNRALTFPYARPDPGGYTPPG